MANPEIQVDVKLNDADYQKGVKGIQNSAKQLSSDFRTLGRELSQVGRTLTFFGGAVTASMTAAFAKAAKDIPIVNDKLKDVGNSFQALADTLATSALPSLNEFSKLINGTVAVISRFAKEHQELFNQFLKYSFFAGLIGTVMFSLGMLVRAIGNIIAAMKTLGIITLATQIPFLGLAATIIGVVAAVAMLTKMFSQFKFSGFVGIGGNLSQSQGQVMDFFRKLQDEYEKLKKTFQNGIDEPLRRTIDVLGKFREGFLSTIKIMNDAVFDFGAGISQALDKGFSDTIFNTITGRFKDLKSIMTSIIDDIARGFSKLASNEIMAHLFGDKEGTRKGLFPNLGSLFGRGGTKPGAKDHQEEVAKNAKIVSRNFEHLTDNMRKFGRAKDDVIDNLKKFGRQLGQTGRPVGGVPRGGEGGNIGIDIGSFEAAGKVTEGLNGILTKTFGLASAIGQAFDQVGQKIIQMGVIYGITQMTMLAISVATSAAMVSIGTATATALAAVWAVPALLVAIATLGVAVAIGAAAVGSAIAAAPAMGIAGVQAGGAFGTSMAGAGGGGGLPSGANITMGQGAFARPMAEGGIVTRPTFALVGESGPEAVLPLKNGRGKFGGNTNVDIRIDTAMLNNPSNMRDFVRVLKEELAR